MIFSLVGCKLSFSKPQSTGSLLVTNGAIFEGDEQPQDSEKISNADITASINLLATVKDILRTDDIYVELSEKLDNKYSIDELKQRIKISQRDDYSLFIDVVVTAQTQEEADKIKNAFLDLAPKYISHYIPSVRVSIFN